MPKDKIQVIKNREVGIPEGLAISNSLANIYLLDIDEKYNSIENISYWRYVDDILLLLKSNDSYNMKQSLNEDIKNHKLEINEKKDEGFIKDGFEYLGYMITDKMVSVRLSSILKIEQSIESIFRSYRGKNNFNYLIWKVNLKVTGFIIEKHKYGWLFFYSQINDLSLLYRLDFLVIKLKNRFFAEKSLDFKRFVRSYYEIRYSFANSTYIPNIDKYSLNRKKEILSEIYEIDVADLQKDQVEYNFHKIMSKEILDIEKDIQSIS